MNVCEKSVEGLWRFFVDLCLDDFSELLQIDLSALL